MSDVRMKPVCGWCYVVSRHRRTGPVVSLRVARECARSGHRHPTVRAATRNAGPRVSVAVALEECAKAALPPVPRDVIEELLGAAERIVAEA
jgi:hypothetical protein